MVHPSLSARRVLVIGIDGAPQSLMRRFADQGHMPHLRSLIDQGELRQMDVPLPEISSVSWSTFSTGVLPARHGIFGFVDLEENSYRTRCPDFRDNLAPTFWDVLGKSGKVSVVVNVPGTYPARPLRGALVSGFVAPDLVRATYPRILLPSLNQIGYRLDVDAHLARTGELDRFVEDCFTTLHARRRAFDLLWTSQPWDCFIATVTETDRFQHYLWSALEEPSHPHHASFFRLYREVDEIIGDLAGRLGPSDVCLIVSDHGFTGTVQEVFLNRFLEEAGFQSLARRTMDLGDLTPETRAFALDPSRIYLHRAERFPRGSVTQEQSETVAQELRDAFTRLRWRDPNGEDKAVIQGIFRGREVSEGPFAHRGPDLILKAEPGFDLKGATHRTAVFGRSALTGMHTADDATFAINRPGLPPRRPHMADLAPTLLDLLGVSVPAGLDGRSLCRPSPDPEPPP